MLQARTGYNLPQIGAASSPQHAGSALRARVLFRRRLLVLILNVVTIASLMAAMAYLLSFGGWGIIKAAMLCAFAITLPWLSIGFWNAVIGSVVLARSSRSRNSDLLRLDHASGSAINTRTAIVMAVRNEAPSQAVIRLRAIHDELAARGLLEHFDFHLLSDTNQPGIAAEEEQLVAQWQTVAPAPRQIFYRRRTQNTGYKAGNIEEFCRRTANTYDFFLPLDADSFMSANAVLRLVRIMQAESRLGILQSLVVGIPSKSLFTRTFQFGMRQGMRSYTAGSAWWQGDCGPYWGHNALIRMRPFNEHCQLPVLPAGGPLGGHVMSHDQIEAVLMRRAGYHVEVLLEEGGSWEENPPTLVDFIRRDLRWCQGNMQYWRLLNMPGVLFMSRVQMALAILMYLGAFGWMTFISLGLVYSITASEIDYYPVWQGASLFVLIILMSLMPKLLGLAAVLANPLESQQYGGRSKVISGGVFELVFSAVVAPIVSFAVSVFMLGLLFGKRLDWRAQDRVRRNVSWSEATAKFASQTMFGIVMFTCLYVYAPAVLPWAMPVIAGLLVSIPLAVITASEWAGRWSVRTGLCDIPEDLSPPLPLAAVMKRLETQLSPTRKVDLELAGPVMGG